MIFGKTHLPVRLELRAHRPVQVKDAARATKRFHCWVNERVALARTPRWAGLCVSLLFALSLVAVPSAQAAQPWWHLETGSRPTNIDPGTAADAVQELTVSATGGTFTLSLEGQTTAPLSYKASAATVKTELQKLSSVGSGNVEVTGGPGVTAPLTIAFVGALRDQPIAPLQANSANLHGGAKEAKLTVLNPGRSDGELYLTAANLGNAPVVGSGSAVQLKDVLPAGLEAIAIAGSKPFKEGNFFNRDPIPCALATLTCALEGSLAPYDALEVRIDVNVIGPVGEPNEALVSGGNAAEASLQRPLTISGEPVPFGVRSYEMSLEEEGGAQPTHAGAHPFQFTTQITLNQNRDLTPLLPGERPEVLQAGLGKDFNFNLPPGLIGNPSKLPRCTTAQFFSAQATGSDGNPEDNACPPDSAVGMAVVTVHEPATAGTPTVPLPIFNLEPNFGEPARFGFFAVIANSPVLIDTSLRSERGPGGTAPDYGVTATVRSITQLAANLSATATFWGIPGASGHDGQRGWGCLYEARGITSHSPCLPSEESHPPVVFSMPTQCATPLATSVDYDSWEDRALRNFQGTFNPSEALKDCNNVPFNAPQIKAEPTSNAATSPTGFKFDINIEDSGLENAGGYVQSQIKRAVVTLPQGFTTNPSVAEGLKACSQQQYEAETVQSEPGAGCPNESKVGEVEIESPLIEGKKVLGSIYVARQKENPNDNLLTLYLVVKNRELGVMVKQALKVTPDPVTGQLSTEVDDIPQLPFSKFHLEFRSGQRSPLVTPPACGTYTVAADLYPYSEPAVPLHRESSFQITTGPEGQPCPSGGTPPFHPNLEAGTTNNAAGTYSPFYVHMTRKDSEQEITHFSIKLPPGVVGKLAGIPFCSDAAIAQAKGLEHEGGGGEEEEHPSCPAASEIGHTLVGSGVGNVLAYAPGKLYLAGPYKGSALSIVSITAAKVGPFDLGTVVVREALKVNPETAEVFVDATGSDPIPHIVAGIPVHLRDIRVYVNRPEFVLNPTSCEPTSTASTVLGSGLNFASEADDQPVTVTSPFQAADCASLPFHPKLKLSLKGSTKRGATPAFKAFLTMKPGEANISRSVVVLPRSEFLDNAHIGTSCTRVQFNAGKIPGEDCPAASVYGHAKAITPILDEPIEGPVFLRSNGGERNLPDLVAALHSGEININLVGFIDSIHHGQIRNRFQAVPDAPVTSFTLEMMGGKKGLLENAPTGSARTLCESKNSTSVEFEGHNGKRSSFNTELKPLACHKHHGKKHHKRARHRRAVR